MPTPDPIDKSLQRGPTDDGRELERAPSSDKHDDDSPPLPHEADQSHQSQEEAEPRDIGEQAHEDLERGLQDTDRRSDANYQQMTRTDQDSPATPPKK